jgi:hypothetical protein
LNFPFPVYFCRKVPVARLVAKVEGDVDAPWFKSLCDDISKNGLASPLLVLHYANEILLRPKPMVVKTGQNRIKALRKLGWKHAPCIIVCNKKDGPPEYLEDLVPLKTLAEGQALLADGILAYEKYESLRINSAMIPEHMRYPSAKVRYFDVD